MGIPKTFIDRNPEDRNWVGDIWTWLQGQPQIAWLYFARHANWDNMDWLFPEMVRHPDCDRALASWLFWRSDPGYFLAQGKSPPRGDLLAAILDRAANGGWPASGLHYQRVEVAFPALGAAGALDRLTGPAPFRIPRELCASFEGANPPLAMDAGTRADWQELGDTFHVFTTTCDEETFRQERDGGNWWFEPALELPRNPLTTPEMTDLEAIDAVFGEHRSAIERIEAVRQGLNGARSSGSATALAETPARKLVRFLGANVVGVGALLAGLHFVGPWAAILVLGLWIAWLIKRFG
ncbi:DUF4274 domain-containing protein [Sphingomonas jaspsi]|uniref:DUF4274 domain-containing protein n=1 Tax=Sphingomonas jaspsi TaxID=392409 RepID=UPI0004B79617|nr:DUF4274 domain-containing protein [Sphingomonas jaspsi]